MAEWSRSSTFVFFSMIILLFLYKPVLCIFNIVAKFCTGQFSIKIGSTMLFSTYVEGCTSTQIGLPKMIWVDRGTCFVENVFIIAIGANIHVVSLGIQVSSSLEIRKISSSSTHHFQEGYNLHVLTFYWRKCTSYVNKRNEWQTKGRRNRVVCALLGAHIRTNILEEPRVPKSTLQQCPILTNTVRAYMKLHMSSSTLNTALYHNMPPSSTVFEEFGDQVLVFLEK